MKLINLINLLVTNSLAVLAVYLAFVKDMLFFEVLIYIFLGLAYIGACIPSVYDDLMKYKWWQYVLTIPFTLTCWYIAYNNGGEVYFFLSLIFNVIVHTVLLNKRIQSR
jgi:hypothetical protein